MEILSGLTQIPIDVMNISNDSRKGYILEVDLSYSKELHDFHLDFPLAPENKFDN